jgi:hypothetical protein
MWGDRILSFGSMRERKRNEIMHFEAPDSKTLTPSEGPSSNERGVSTNERGALTTSTTKTTRGQV